MAQNNALDKTQFSKMSKLVRSKTKLRPRSAIVLGSGLGGLANAFTEKTIVPYSDLPGFPISSAPGHAGQLVIGKLNGVPLLAFQGRVHLYEGYSAKEVAAPIRLAHALGIKNLVLTNACGGLNPHWHTGDIMLILDYINFTGHNPLTGPNDKSIGPRFPSMTEAFDPEFCEHARDIARKQNLVLREGVYLQIAGPNYAPKAELRMFRNFGADVIGMSTSLEVIAARHAGLRVLGLSSITDMAIADREDHSQTNETNVIEQAKKTGPRFQKLLSQLIKKL